MKNEQTVNFVLETAKVAEIKSDADDWAGDGVQTIDSQLLAEMVEGDEKPFFVEFISLYEGVSGNDREYTREAVQSCVDAMIGVNMYKGHEEPGTASWRYREPVGRIVAARVAEVEIDGRRVQAAKGKAYITEADAKLRSDIKRGMAGPLSILGNARAVRELGKTRRTITHLHKPLKSIDFCNPGTNGMALAGVTAVVREMSGQIDPEENTMKLTKEQLLAEYSELVQEVVSEAVRTKVTEMATKEAELATAQQAVTAAKAAHDTQIAEMKQTIDTVTAERDTLKTQIAESEKRVMQAELDKFAVKHVAEMKAGETDDQIVEMAAAEVTASIVDGDLEKSKTAFKGALTKAVEKLVKISEMFGGQKPATAKDETRRHDGNQKSGKKTSKLSDLLSPELLKGS